MKMLFAMFPTILLVTYAQLIAKWRIPFLAESMMGPPVAWRGSLFILKTPMSFLPMLPLWEGAWHGCLSSSAMRYR